METEEGTSQPHCAFPRAFSPIQRDIPGLNTTVTSLKQFPWLEAAQGFPCSRRIPWPDLRPHCAIGATQESLRSKTEGIIQQLKQALFLSQVALCQTRLSVQPGFCSFLSVFPCYIFFLSILNEGYPGPEHPPRKTSQYFNTRCLNKMLYLSEHFHICSFFVKTIKEIEFQILPPELPLNEFSVRKFS